MTDYSELVKALRDIEKTMFALGTSPINMGDVSISLAYDKRWGQTAEAAASAIEALEKEIRESMQKCAECGDEQEQKVKELQARLGEAENSAERWKDMYLTKHESKRGEWVEENRRPRSSQFICSECHRTAYDPQPTRDKAWRKRCRYAYCPNCGAKMEVQDEGAGSV